MSAQTFVFDLDGTLCTNTEGDYEAARPLPWAVARVNALRRAGHRIVVFTARGTTTGIDWRPVTERQLRAWGVEYDELHLGKPYGDVYVDDKALHVDAWHYGHAHELSGPGRAPPRAPGVLEVARTFGGRPFRLQAHAEVLLERAREARLVSDHTAADIVAAAEESLHPAVRLLEPGDDIVLAISLIGTPHAAFLDTVGEDPAGELLVTCRLLSQPAGELAALEARWPLRSTPAGLVDRLGGEVATTKGGTVVLRPGARGVACELARAAAADAGLEVAEGAPLADGAEEVLVLGLPFCFIAVGAPGAPGALAAALRERWRRETGVDVAGQLRALRAT